MKQRRRAYSVGKRSTGAVGITFVVGMAVMLLAALVTYNTLAVRSPGNSRALWGLASWLPSLPVAATADSAYTQPDTPTRPMAVNRPRRSATPPTPRSYIVAAGRSPIPQPGETIDKPFAARRLAFKPTGKQPPAPNRPVRWVHADRYIGQQITVWGRVVSTRRTDSVCFLNFAKDWHGLFYVVIFKDALDDWPQPPETYFLNKNVRVKGKVSIYKGRAQIRVQDPSQVLAVR